MWPLVFLWGVTGCDAQGDAHLFRMCRVERRGRVPLTGSRCGSDLPRQLRTLDEIVADYIRNVRPRKSRELRFYMIQRSLQDAVHVAARVARQPRTHS